jgi:hypothetical protein
MQANRTHQPQNFITQEQFASFAPDLPVLERAILITIAYADIFDFPRTLEEIYRFIVGERMSREVISQALAENRSLRRVISQSNGFFTLRGREEIAEVRNRRTAVGKELWPKAIRYGHILAHLPFVRMVCLTGALAVDNADFGTDIDYLLVTEPDRLWLCRAWSILLVRMAALNGDIICPNYFLSERAIVLQQRNLYTAHEMAQMIPLSGFALYQRFRDLNRWTENYLPNASEPSWRTPEQKLVGRPWRMITEKALRSPAGGYIENWEMNRKIRKFSRLTRHHVEANFSPDWCKGHFDNHGQLTLLALQERLHRIQEMI